MVDATLLPPSLKPFELDEVRRKLGAFDVLSLDCFDTLLWRRGSAPQDVFADLDIPGGGMAKRMSAEARARSRTGGGEVDLLAIYAELMPRAAAQERDQAIERELAAEAAHCFGFKPVVDLLLAAKSQGLRTIVVSDTYLSSGQLRTLIKRAAGDDVEAAIDTVYCSSEFGIGKAGGLFGRLLPMLQVDPARLLHLGDNKAADFDAPRKIGAHGVHLRQFSENAAKRLRLEATAQSLFDQRVRVDQPAWQMHRALVALGADGKPEQRLGSEVLAPLMIAFVAWLEREAQRLAAQGKPPKVVFLLRDGFLPAKVYEEQFGLRATTASISRFAARRASFRGLEDIDAYLATERHDRLDVHARTLGLEERECREAQSSMIAFRRFVRRPAIVEKIVERSRGYARRLARHLRKAGVRSGDHVMFVDLGYNGTVQNLLAPVLSAEFGIECSGRYLLLCENDLSGLDKRGLFDARHYDDRALRALTRSISVLEQLCTNGLGSVVDYRDTGEAFFLKRTRPARHQREVRETIQRAALEAISNPSRQWLAALNTSEDAQRTSALGILARLLFMPSAEEAVLFEAFRHDVNLGTQDENGMLDHERSRRQLREQGLKALGRSDRLYSPAELTAQSFELTLANAVSARLQIDLRDGDVQQGGRQVSVIYANGADQHLVELTAWPTRDGFFRLVVPMGEKLAAAGILFGRVAAHVELTSVGQVEVERLGDDRWDGEQGRTQVQLTLDGLQGLGGDLYRCGPQAIAFVEPVRAGSENVAIEIVFRPIGEPMPQELRLAA